MAEEGLRDERIRCGRGFVTRSSSDIEAVTYELNRLEEFLVQYEATPGLREQVIKLIDYAAWEQLSTSLRGLRQTSRNIGSQVKKPRLPYQEID